MSSSRAQEGGRFRRYYGAGPLHLLGHVLLILVTAAALSIMFQPRFAPEPLNLLLWLVGGALLHDLVLLPAYSLVNAAATRFAVRDGHRLVPLLNHVRVPLLISGLLLLLYFPAIFDLQPGNFERALGHPRPDVLSRYLVVVALLFAASAGVWAIRRLRAR